jgi:hypothetical protein
VHARHVQGGSEDQGGVPQPCQKQLTTSAANCTPKISWSKWGTEKRHKGCHLNLYKTKTQSTKGTRGINGTSLNKLIKLSDGQELKKLSLQHGIGLCSPAFEHRTWRELQALLAADV